MKYLIVVGIMVIIFTLFFGFPKTPPKPQLITYEDQTYDQLTSQVVSNTYYDKSQDSTASVCAIEDKDGNLESASGSCTVKDSTGMFNTAYGSFPQQALTTGTDNTGLVAEEEVR